MENNRYSAQLAYLENTEESGAEVRKTRKWKSETENERATPGILKHLPAKSQMKQG